MASGFSLKDQLFNLEKTRYLAGLFAAADPGFDADGFEAQVMARFPELELKQRIHWIAEVLAGHYSGPLPEVAPVLLSALPPPLDPGKSDDDFGDFIFAPLGEFVIAKGIEDHPDLTLDLLEALTQRFSMEYAIRPMLNRWPDLTLTRMQDWVRHENYHVRRLVSEGTRPRLPWGLGIGLDLRAPLPLLDHLHGDSTRFVTRSVANHLNDIARKDPDLVVDTLRRWGDGGLQTGKEMDWMTRHACRGLVKAGHPGALGLLGYDPEAPVTAQILLEVTSVPIGEALCFSVVLAGPEDQPVLVDYRLHFQRPGGKTSAKVFKLKQAHLMKGRLTLSKRHRMKGDATTFTLVPGTHRIEILVNGTQRAEMAFELTG
ncbi:hypothetical protein PXK00_10665 [Phaeobacter sp. QD34_3]|uniref:hypothetical protein n=1 Tax=unclassified Phaeobacter TaxID=2621772 RepID=UPI00237F71CC|nr:MULTISPECIES: hypothetical protein [unclassified Phaeobacter]MDE4133578.1 hypothetical protein [Phaeobacter sp. QD34_3]MDE4137214.1 hypothetical protein [Phaeobacter sp. QD34_24]